MKALFLKLVCFPRYKIFLGRVLERVACFNEKAVEQIKQIPRKY
jgi:hypothetical protein